MGGLVLTHTCRSGPWSTESSYHKPISITAAISFLFGHITRTDLMKKWDTDCLRENKLFFSFVNCWERPPFFLLMVCGEIVTVILLPRQGSQELFRNSSVESEGKARVWKRGQRDRGIRRLVIMFKLLDQFLPTFRLSVKKVINYLYYFSWIFFLIQNINNTLNRKCCLKQDGNYNRP